MTTKAENTKITAAMKARRAEAEAAKKAKAQAEEDRTRPIKRSRAATEIQVAGATADAKKVVADTIRAILVGHDASGIPTAAEAVAQTKRIRARAIQAAKGIAVHAEPGSLADRVLRAGITDADVEEIQDVGVPAPLAPGAVLGVPSRKARGAQQRSQTVKTATTGGKVQPAKKERATRVLADPVANAKLVRMRAKWAAIRADRKAAKVEEKYGEQSPEATEARHVAKAAWTDEGLRFMDYQFARKAAKANPVVVADPADDAEDWTESEKRAMAGDR